MVFSNASIWVFQQMYESLYERHPGRQGRQAAAGRELHAVGRQAHLDVQAAPGREVQQRPADDVGRRQVLARQGPRHQRRLGVPRRRDRRRRRRPTPDTVVVKTKYPWAPLLADLANFSNAVLPKDYAGKTQGGVLQGARSAPARSCGTTGPRAASSSSRRTPPTGTAASRRSTASPGRSSPTTTPATCSSRAARRRSTRPRRSPASSSSRASRA